ncbi:hypothetical protein BGX23_008939 [Mortierella sp. AD031]|nr:hypothetical protein BGX23_008939 [Mortierella sp. AD031]
MNTLNPLFLVNPITKLTNNMTDPFEEYFSFVPESSFDPADNASLDFQQWNPLQTSMPVTLSGSTSSNSLQASVAMFTTTTPTAGKTTEILKQLLQEQPGLSTIFSDLSLSDVPLFSNQDPGTLTLNSLPSSSWSMYEDSLGLTWPTSEVSFADFDMQDLSFLDSPFAATGSTTTTATITPILDFQSQLDQVYPGNFNNNGSDSVMSVADGLGYSLAPAEAIMLLPSQMSHLIPESSHSIDPFRSAASVSDLFLPQMDTCLPSQIETTNSSETAPVNIPLLWSTFPSITQPMASCTSTSSGSSPLTSSAQVVPGMPPLPSQIQDPRMRQGYLPTAFLMEGMIPRPAAATLLERRQARMKTTTLSRRDSVATTTANGVNMRPSPYARPQYPQEPKKRRASGLSDDDDESDGDGCFKLQKTGEYEGATPNYLAVFDTSRRQYEQSLQAPLIHEQSASHPTVTVDAGGKRGRGTGKTEGGGRRGRGVKKTTDCAHYRPRNAFFMFRGFVSHLQTHLHAKQLSASSSSPTTSSCSMTSASPDIIDNSPDSSSTSFSYSPLFDPSPTQSDTRPHFMSLSLPPASHSSTAIQPPPTPSPSPLRATATTKTTTTSTGPRRRQVQTKVSVSCGKIWSSPCLPTCGLGGCANCRMRSLFRQASDFLKLRQTEIERQIEFPLSHQNDMWGNEKAEGEEMKGNKDTVGTMVMMTRMRLEDSFNWKEFEQLYYHSDLFKWHRDIFLKDNDTNDNNNMGAVLDIEEMKAVWMENELAYEKAFSEGARKRIALDGFRTTIGFGIGNNSSSSNKKTASTLKRTQRE